MNSNQSKAKANFLRLVDARPIPDPISNETFVHQGWRTTLFANESPSLLLFISFERVTEEDFNTVLTGARPRYLFDLRRAPRFDLGSLNRRQAFSLFSQTGVQYVDLSGQLKLKNENAGEQTPKLVAELIIESTNQPFIRGPIAFIVDAQQFEEAYITQLIEALPSRSNAPWDVLRIPISDGRNAEKELNRSLVFISHANPQDNDFATWLAGQLTLAGYSVWSDVTKLVGGETFWDDIEGAIRYRSAKVVAVLSKEAGRKPGVLDEIDLAVRVERSAGLHRFILPVRVDDLPYSQVRANIARKVIIDFSDNWASGLYSLLSVLELDRVPRSIPGGADALGRWVSERCSQFSNIVPKPERLTSNWLPIAKLPDYVFLHSVSSTVEQIETIVQSTKYPCFRYLRLIGSFSTSGDLHQDLPPEISLVETYRIKITNFLAGKPLELPGMTRPEAHKTITSLLRQAWNLRMQYEALRSFETASGHLAWYMPKGLLEGDRVEFTDELGKKRRKSLVGWSERRKVFWHFALEARPVLGDFPHFVLKQHVIFTPDGISPVDNKERMHLLRRRFCKNWWNDRWRDLLIAFVSWLSRNGECALPVGLTSHVKLNDKLMAVLSPVSIDVDQTTPTVSFDEEDQLDSGEDTEALDDWPDEQSETAGT